MLEPLVHGVREALQRKRYRAESQQQRLVVGDDSGRLELAPVHPSGGCVGHAAHEVDAAGLGGWQTAHRCLLSAGRLTATIDAITTAISSAKPPRLAALSAPERWSVVVRWYAK